VAQNEIASRIAENQQRAPSKRFSGISSSRKVSIENQRNEISASK
jgi:hypothetical protein